MLLCWILQNNLDLSLELILKDKSYRESRELGTAPAKAQRKCLYFFMAFMVKMAPESHKTRDTEG